MSDFVSKADCSDQNSTDSVSCDKSSSSDSDEYHFEGHFLPYQDEPRGSSSDESHESDDAPDTDGITRAVLEKRYEKQIPVQQWCTCGGCEDSLLVGSREYRCCKEILEATGKFTFEGLNAACILSHHHFGSLTNRTVMLQVGPLLKSKSGKRYQKYGQSENEFLRAVAYRWLARSLFGEMGWENTRPLSACIYNHIRKTLPTDSTVGYSSGQERAPDN